MALRDIVDDHEVYEANMAEAEPFLLRDAALAVRFNALEEQVMILARGDRMATLDPPNLIDRIAAALFGIGRRTRQLADPRLEALRCAVIVTLHRRHLPDPQAAELRVNGFSPQQIKAIETRALAG